MSIILHLNISAFPMILLAVIFVSMRRKAIQTTDIRLFSRLVGLTFVLLLAELLSWAAESVPGETMRILGYLTNIAYFGLIPAVSLTWFDYSYFNICKKLAVSAAPPLRALVYLPPAAYLVLLISSPWTGIIFTLSDRNGYARGPLFWLLYAICLVHLFSSAIISLRACRERGELQRRHYIRLAGYTLMPIVAAVVQAALGEVWIMLPCAALTELLLYIYIQRQSIKKDALTGINNRGCLNEYLLGQFEQESRRRTLCLFILDLDHFKLINDTLGHTVGDAALAADFHLGNGTCYRGK